MKDPKGYSMERPERPERAFGGLRRHPQGRPGREKARHCLAPPVRAGSPYSRVSQRRQRPASAMGGVGAGRVLWAPGRLGGTRNAWRGRRPSPEKPGMPNVDPPQEGELGEPLPNPGVDDAIAGSVRDIRMPEVAAQDAIARHARFLHHPGRSRMIHVAEGFRPVNRRMR